MITLVSSCFLPWANISDPSVFLGQLLFKIFFFQLCFFSSCFHSTISIIDWLYEWIYEWMTWVNIWEISKCISLSISAFKIYVTCSLSPRLLKHSWSTNGFQELVFCYQNCSDLLWEKIVLVIEKNFWNSRLKAENFQNFWDH